MLDPVRRAVLIDMAYEIGGAGLANFKKFLAAMRAGRWSEAATELKDSLLFEQVPTREQENIITLVTGKFPPGIDSAEEYIKRHEGCTFTAEPDAKGKWALGYGHDVPPGPLTCTQGEADAWFKSDFELATARAIGDLGAEYW